MALVISPIKHNDMDFGAEDEAVDYGESLEDDEMQKGWLEGIRKQAKGRNAKMRRIAMCLPRRPTMLYLRCLYRRLTGFTARATSCRYRRCHLAFHHPITDSSRSAPFWAGLPVGTPTAPRSFGRISNPPNVSPLTRASASYTPRPSTCRRMTQQNAAAFQRHVGHIAGEESTTRRKAAPPTLPEPQYPQSTMLWQLKKGENGTGDKRRVEQNEIMLQRVIHQQEEERPQDWVARESVAGALSTSIVIGKSASWGD
ncbi:hypothetical protein PQX77_018170 [Marasmius sp. AFHP31]|nr:hypothetical protein PQX77_018170 [Marasmius sp. AFHP31]